MAIINPYFYALNPDILAYENAYVNYMKNGERNETIICDAVWESWERCSQSQLAPYSKSKIPQVLEAEVFGRMAKIQELMTIVTPFIDTIYEEVGGPGFFVGFADCDAVLLRCISDDEIQERCNEVGLVAGANLAEEMAGTNTVDLAVRLRKPISMTGAEHYREIFHDLTSAAAPLFDYSGNMLGVINIWGKHEHGTKHLLSILIASAKAIENDLQIKRINKQLIENNNQLTTILQSVSDGVVYVRDNIVTQTNDEMLQLLGRPRSKVENKNVESVIITSPEINAILRQRDKEHKNFRATLLGQKKSYNCVLSKRKVFGSNNKEIGQVLIFKEVEEINKLVKAINQHKAKYTFDDIIGNAAALRAAIDIAQKAAVHDSRIIIEGESGTGKEMFAQAIHNASARCNGSFVAIDCGAIPSSLFESTLFGYEKGAFTGAKDGGETGAFEVAHRGTLFLDEIENLPLEMQVKLLRTLQEKTITKVGSSTPISVDVRVIAATNADLLKLVHEGTFREDLFYRLNVVNINTPPLRARKSDIPQLVTHYLNVTYTKSKRPAIEKPAIDVLQRYDWPGNIRQLFNAIERACIMTNSAAIKAQDLPLEIIQASNGNTGWRDDNASLECSSEDMGGSNAVFFCEEGMTLRKMTNWYILHSLDRNNHNISKTAKELGINRATVYSAINAEEGGEK